MIDRTPNRRHVMLRRTTFQAAAAVSASVFLLAPVAAIGCFVAGWIAYGACYLGMLLLGVAALLLIVIGGLLVIAGITGGGDEMAGPGVLAGILGLGGVALHNHCSKSVCAAGDAALEACHRMAEFLAVQVFIGWGLCLWSWSVLAIVGLAAVCVLALIGCLRLEGFAKLRLFGISFTCPACHAQGEVHFRCPTCSALASDLAPSPFGVFYAYCQNCQTVLPTLDALGRLDLAKICGHCQEDLDHPGLGRQRELHIAIVGAPSSGKTMLLAASVWQLAHDVVRSQQFQVQFRNEQQEKTLNNFIAGMAAGTPLAKTPSALRPRAFNVSVLPAGQPASLLYLYDAAGEDLMAENTMSGHGHHQFLDGLLVVIDPFAECLFRHGAGAPDDRTAWSHVNPAAINAAFVIEPFMNRIEQQMNVSAKDVIPISVAVVVTKVAAISPAPWADSLRSSSNDPAGDRIGADHERSAQIRTLLLNMGLANTILGLESRFETVNYFATSIMEQMPGVERHGALSSAAAPLVWLLEQSHALPQAHAA